MVDRGSTVSNSQQSLADNPLVARPRAGGEEERSGIQHGREFGCAISASWSRLSRRRRITRSSNRSSFLPNRECLWFVWRGALSCRRWVSITADLPGGTTMDRGSTVLLASLSSLARNPGTSPAIDPCLVLSLRQLRLRGSGSAPAGSETSLAMEGIPAGGGGRRGMEWSGGNVA